MMRARLQRARFGLSGLLAVGMLAVRAAGAEEEGETAADRAERLMKVIETEVGEGQGGNPSVLADVDLKSSPPAVRKIVRVLREKKVDFMLEKQTVDSTLEILRDVSGLNFAVSARARQALKEENAEVTMTLHDLPLENCLNLLALHLRDYRFVIRYGAVLLIRAEEYKPRRIVRFYNVSDIVRPLPDFPAPQLGLGVPEK